jgi:hypothetical protein
MIFDTSELITCKLFIDHFRDILLQVFHFIYNSIFKVDGGYGALSAEGLGENSSFAGCSTNEPANSRPGSST